MTHRVTMWSANGLTVEASLGEDGEVTISGHDLSGQLFDEYEYAITVPATAVPRVVRALGGSRADEVLVLLQRHGELIVRAGETSWLRGLGVEAGFWSWP